MMSQQAMSIPLMPATTAPFGSYMAAPSKARCQINSTLNGSSPRTCGRSSRMTRTSRPGPKAPDFIKQWVSYGASVRAAQALILGAKARALLQGRTHVSFDDVRSLADLYMPFGEFNDLIGVTAQLALAERYRDDERSAT